MMRRLRSAVVALLVVATESAVPAVDSRSSDIADDAVNEAIDAETGAQSEVEQMEDQAVQTAVRVKQLRRLLREVRQVASVVSGKDNDLLLEKPMNQIDELITPGAARRVAASLWKNALKLEHRIRPNEPLDAQALGVPHFNVDEVQQQLSETQEEAEQAKSNLKRFRFAAVRSTRAVVAAEEETQGKVEAALEQKTAPIQSRLSSAYTMLERASVEAEEAAQDAQVAEENDSKIALAVNKAEAALQVARQDLAPLSGQLQSLSIIELGIRQSMIQNRGNLANMSQILESANLGNENDAKKADAAFKTTKVSLAKAELQWQTINAQRTKLHHHLQEKVARLASDAEEFQGTLHDALSADLALLNGLHGLGDEEIVCDGVRADLVRIQGYLKQIQHKEKTMKAELTTEMKNGTPLMKIMHVSEIAAKDAIRMVAKASKEPGESVTDSALENSAMDAIKNLEAMARSLEQKIAKFETQSLTRARIDFKHREDTREELALATAIQHAKSEAANACKVSAHLNRIRIEARKSRAEARVFGSHMAGTERIIFAIQHDLATVGENRKKFRKELHILRDRAIVLSENAGRLAQDSRLTKLLRTELPWEVVQSIANERVELEGHLTQKQVAVHENERILSGLQSQMREFQSKLGKALKGVSTGRNSMQKARREVRDLEKQLNLLRKNLETVSSKVQLGSDSQKSRFGSTSLSAG